MDFGTEETWLSRTSLLSGESAPITVTLQAKREAQVFAWPGPERWW